MKLVWLNANKRACKQRFREYFQQFVDRHNPGGVFFVEFRQSETEPETELDAHTFICGSRNLALFLGSGTSSNLMAEVTDCLRLYDFGDYVCGAVYLDPTKGGKRRIEQLMSVSRAVASRNKPIVLAGDFNTVLRPEDGVFDGSVSKWTGPKESRSISAFLNDLDLVDPFVERSMPQQFTFEGANRGRPFKFRSDLLLCSRHIANAVRYEYDHRTRLGPGSFTDHSAIVAELPGITTQPAIP